jgi:hypothetical protein
MGVSANQYCQDLSRRRGQGEHAEGCRQPRDQGFTTNPTLMRKAGIVHYEGFARDILTAIPDRPMSFEVFSDHFDDTYARAFEIATWGRTSTSIFRLPTPRRRALSPYCADSPRTATTLSARVSRSDPRLPLVDRAPIFPQ